MNARKVAGAPLDFVALRTELEVPGDFSAAVLADAQAAAQRQSASQSGGDGTSDDATGDATDIEFVTIDPPGSRDLDQALHLSRSQDGYVVHYAIADVASFVNPGSALDDETRHRGETLYFPDRSILLHPAVLSEGAASLLPGQIRPAALWRIALDVHGRVRTVAVRRALVRSRTQYDYAQVQTALESGAPEEWVTLLAEIGRCRLALARERHSIDLGLPDQQVESDPATGWRLTSRAPLDVERYNAEISLLTGMCAAAMMLDAGVGVLRTLPPPDPVAIGRLRRAAHALDVHWPKGTAAGDVLAGLDRSDPKHVAFLEHAASLLRGAGYTTFDGTRPALTVHAGIGAPYAHVTAPLRRLVDRFGTEICLAAQAGRAIPTWVLTGLSQLPADMHRADERAHTVDRAVLDTTEAWLLRDQVGSTFNAVVIDADKHGGTIVIDAPAVRAHCTGDDLPVGERIRARLVAADITTRKVGFARA